MPPPREDRPDLPSEKMISRAIGLELRHTRESLGWSRLHLAARLPSGIGDRTLLSYEHGSRNLTALRLIEIGYAMETDPSMLMSRGLQRARILLQNLALEVDLRALLHDQNGTFRPMRQWARNTLNVHPDGIAHIEPTVAQNLALFIGCPYLDLVNYLSRFIPDN